MNARLVSVLALLAVIAWAMCDKAEVRAQVSEQTGQSAGRASDSAQTASDKASELGMQLLTAAAAGNLDQVKVLLSQGAALESTDQDFGATPLVWAAAKGHQEVVEFLLQQGVDPNARIKAGLTARDVASQQSFQHIVTLLDSWARSREAATAGAAGQTKSIGPAAGGLSDAVNVQELSLALLQAAASGKALDVRDLLANGANIETTDAEHGATPLLWATAKGSKDVVALLLEKGANMAATLKAGLTPRDVAAQQGFHEIVRMLDARAGGMAPTSQPVQAAQTGSDQILLAAATEGNEQMLRELLRQGANPNVSNEAGVTPLAYAAYLGNKSMAQALLEKGADANVANSDGWTPLALACEKGHKEIVKLLLENGADANASTKAGWSCLAIANTHGHKDVAKALKAKGGKELQPRAEVQQQQPRGGGRSRADYDDDVSAGGGGDMESSVDDGGFGKTRRGGWR